jgi:hypothetical protein
MDKIKNTFDIYYFYTNKKINCDDVIAIFQRNAFIGKALILILLISFII